MVQRLQLLLFCDLHDGDHEASETVTFKLHGDAYEIDLCEEHSATLRETLSVYVQAARTVTDGLPGDERPGSGARSRRVGTGSVQLQDVRAWARSNGEVVKERGRVPRRILEAFEAAH